MTPAPQPVPAPAPAPGGYPGVGSNVGIIILCDRDRGLRTKILKTASEVALYIPLPLVHHIVDFYNLFRTPLNIFNVLNTRFRHLLTSFCIMMITEFKNYS